MVRSSLQHGVQFINIALHRTLLGPFIQRLLKIKKDEDIVNIQLVALALIAEVEAYFDGNLDPPLLEPLRPYFDNVEHPWNEALAEQFNIFVLNECPDILATDEDLQAYFIQHLRVLRRLLIKQLPRNEEDSPDDAVKCYHEMHQ